MLKREMVRNWRGVSGEYYSWPLIRKERCSKIDEINKRGENYGLN